MKYSRPVLYGNYDIPKGALGYQIDNYYLKRIERSGCIFFTFENGQTWFCMGRDLQSKDLTDFSGRKHFGESIIACAAREANEESMEVFGTIEPNHIYSNWTLYNKEMMICFIPVIPEDNEKFSVRKIAEDNFKRQISRLKNLEERQEVEELVWLSAKQLETALSARPQSGFCLYGKVRRFLCSFFNQNVEGVKLFNSHLLSVQFCIGGTESKLESRVAQPSYSVSDNSFYENRPSKNPTMA